MQSLLLTFHYVKRYESKSFRVRLSNAYQFGNFENLMHQVSSFLDDENVSFFWVIIFLWLAFIRFDRVYARHLPCRPSGAGDEALFQFSFFPLARFEAFAFEGKREREEQAATSTMMESSSSPLCLSKRLFILHAIGHVESLPPFCTGVAGTGRPSGRHERNRYEVNRLKFRLGPLRRVAGCERSAAEFDR